MSQFEPGHQIRTDDVFRCPCGYETTFSGMGGHRKRPLKPKCQGKPEFVRPGSGTGKPLAPVWGKQNRPTPDTPRAHLAEPEPEPVADAPAKRPSLAGVYEHRPTFDDVTDPEAIARQLNQALLSERSGAQSPPEAALAALGGGLGGLFPEITGGDWQVEPPRGAQQLSQDRLTITLPSVVKVWYDWAREQGWHQGDGSLSAFVLDMISDHWAYCWNMLVAVVPRSDLAAVVEGD